LNLKRLGFFVFKDWTKRLTSRMWLSAQFYVAEVVREALKKTTEPAMLQKRKERDRVIRDLALV
jgi:hypothetical protein